MVPLPGVPVTPLPRGRCPGALRKRSRRLDLRVDARAASRAAPAAVRPFRPTLIYERYALFADAGRRVRGALGIPWVLEVDAPRSWEAALFEGLPVDAATVAAETALLRAADRVVVVSPALERWVLGRGVQPDRVRLVPNAADVSPAAPEGPYRLGYAGTFKRWHALPESVPALARLARRVGPLRLELYGDGPEHGALLDALRDAPVEVHAPGWVPPSALDVARSRWHAAWVPRPAAWPPDPVAARRLEPVFGEPCPGRWFDPLKGAEARAAGLPVWDGTDRDPARAPEGVGSWTSAAEAAVAGLQWKDPGPFAGSRIRSALVGAAGGARP